MVGDVAPWDAAASIAVNDDAPCAVGNDVLRPAHRDGNTFVDEHRGEQSIAGEVLADGVGQEVSGGVAHASVDVEVHVDPKPIAPFRGSNGVERPITDLTERVDPGDVDLTVVEQRITCLE